MYSELDWISTSLSLFKSSWSFGIIELESRHVFIIDSNLSFIIQKKLLLCTIVSQFFNCFHTIHGPLYYQYDSDLKCTKNAPYRHAKEQTDNGQPKKHEMVDASVSYDKLAEQLSRECSRQSKMDKPDSSMSSSVRIGFVTIMTLLQTILIWRSTRFALEITSEQNMVGLRSNGFIIESDPVETLHHSTSAQFRMDGRTLIGIMAAESLDVNHYVKVQREVLSLHPNVCSLQQFQEMRSSSCLLVYTFVVGANEQGPSEIVNDAYPILASNASVSFGDVDDVTLLNIRYVFPFVVNNVD